jgi:hypothetical protein
MALLLSGTIAAGVFVAATAESRHAPRAAGLSAGQTTSAATAEVISPSDAIADPAAPGSVKIEAGGIDPSPIERGIAESPSGRVTNVSVTGDGNPRVLTVTLQVDAGGAPAALAYWEGGLVAAAVTHEEEAAGGPSFATHTRIVDTGGHPVDGMDDDMSPNDWKEGATTAAESASSSAGTLGLAVVSSSSWAGGAYSLTVTSADPRATASEVGHLVGKLIVTAGASYLLQVVDANGATLAVYSALFGRSGRTGSVWTAPGIVSDATVGTPVVVG